MRHDVRALAGAVCDCRSCFDWLAVFGYTAGQHDVVPVDALSYADCATPDNAPALTSGNDLVVLEQPGQFFLISNVEGDCDSGMKLAIIVQ